MEGVEDIPGTALAQGIRWDWESFPEYLDALDAMPRAVDIAAHLPHGALRAYVMGERGADNETATDDDLEQMGRLSRDALAAGAVGISTSRTAGHMAVDGRPVPGTHAAERELWTLGDALADHGRGLFQLVATGTTGEIAGDPPGSAGAGARMDGALRRRHRPCGHVPRHAGVAQSRQLEADTRHRRARPPRRPPPLPAGRSPDASACSWAISRG